MTAPANRLPPAPVTSPTPPAAAPTPPAAAPAPPTASLARRLLTLARPFLAPLGLSAAARALQLAAGVALVGLAGWAVGAQAAGVPGAWPLGRVVGVMAALSLAKGLLRYAEQFCGHLAAFKALAWLRVFFYDRLEPQAPAAVTARGAGDLLARVTKDVDRVEVFFAHTLAPALTAVLVPAGTVAAYAVLVSPAGAGVLAAGLVLAGLAVPLLGARRSAAAAASLRAGRGGLAEHITDSVQGVREVVSFGYGQRRLDEQAALEEPVRAGLTTLGAWTAVRRGLNTAVVLATLGAESALVAGASGQPLAPAQWPVLGLALGLAVASFPPVLAVEDFSSDLHQAFASARRLFAVTDATPLVPDTGTVPVPRQADGAPPPSVQFDHVTFTHPGLDGRPSRLAPALDDVSLALEAGQVTALVGASGSGKSTLAALLVRSWDPDQGSINYDGRDLRDYPLAGLRAAVGVTEQRPYLFNTSLADNLRLAAPDASDAELVQALGLAGLDGYAAAHGLDAPVGDLGERLSGGERQRLALARTLLAAPDLLVLDEATSQVDAATEAVVLERLRQARAGRTTLVIAHRLSTLRGVDRILVLDAGRVVQQGSYDDLAQADGPFRALLEREAG